MSQHTDPDRETTKAVIELLLLAVFVLSALLAETTLRGGYSAVFSGSISLAQAVGRRRRTEQTGSKTSAGAYQEAAQAQAEEW